MLQRFFTWLKSLFTKPIVSAPLPPIENISPIPLPPQLRPVAPLSWEKNQPSRAAWSVELYSLVSANLSMLEQAKDIIQIRPDYWSFNTAQRITVWCEFFSAIAYYECGWDPKASSQDVGTSDRNTWSVGLLQLSVVDQESYNIPLGYTFDDLKDPYKNLKLGIAILTHQVAKHGKLLIPQGESGVYWATIHPGGKYDKTDSIKAMVAKLNLGIINPNMGTSETPWMGWLRDRIGRNETNDDEYLSQYWKYTDYHPGTVRGADNAWCAMTICAALEETGYKSSRDAMAISFKDVGEACGLKYGAIMVIEHASGSHHVTTCYNIVSPNDVDCLGGSQSDALKVSRYHFGSGGDKIIAIRWPSKR